MLWGIRIPNLEELKDQLLKTVDHVIEKGRWDNSFFLKNILKQLQELREYIVRELTDSDLDINQRKAAHQQLQTITQEKSGHQRVYIALYQSEADRLDRWVIVIKTLISYGITRPIYATEAEVQGMIRDKQGKGDAYVTVWVKETDILSSSLEGATLKDRSGNNLLRLREGFFRLENVVEFVLDGQHYHLINQNLVLSDIA